MGSRVSMVLALATFSSCGRVEGENESAGKDGVRADSSAATTDEASGGFSLASGLTAGPFEVPAAGCPAAHCNNSNGDATNMPALPSESRILRTVTEFGGSIFGLGCSSNGSLVACTYGPSLAKSDAYNLAVFDANGATRWFSKGVTGGGPSGIAFTSAPLIDQSGKVIAADHRQLVRYSSTGERVWSSPFPSPGFPISPVRMDDGTIFLARQSGSILAYAIDDGAFLGELVLKHEADPSIRCDTVNTPATRGKRAYVVTECSANDPNYPDVDVPLARLFALDVDAQAADPAMRLRVAWAYDFRADSGASPTVIGDRIYFDGMGVAGGQEVPTTFGLRDLGGSYAELFARQRVVPVKAQASYAPDPRGGLWTYGLGDSFLVRFDDMTGAELQRIDVTQLLNTSVPYGPSSAITVSGTAARPVITVSAKVTTWDDVIAPIYVLGIDVVSGTRTFAVRSGESSLDTPPGQFPIVKDAAGNLRMFFTTLIKGPVVVGLPAR